MMTIPAAPKTETSIYALTKAPEPRVLMGYASATVREPGGRVSEMWRVPVYQNAPFGDGISVTHFAMHSFESV